MPSKGQSTLYNILIVVIVIGVLSVLGGIGYLGYQKWFGPEEKPVSKEEPIPEKKGEEEEEPPIVDCGVAAPNNPNPQAKQCFEEKFASCEPAKVIYTFDPEKLSFYYEILGPEGSLCLVKSRFLKNPNPEWVNKEMTCSYDNSKKFQTAVEDMSRCQGELYDLMTGGK